MISVYYSESCVLRRTAAEVSSGYAQPDLHEIVVWTALSPAECREYVQALQKSESPFAALRRLREICFRSRLPLVRAFLSAFLADPNAGKIVIASGSTTHLDEVQGYLESILKLNDKVLDKKDNGASPSLLRLDGSTPVKKRQGIVEQFRNSNSNTSVPGTAASRLFLLSTRAGGVGLDLTA